ncbi:hypothetical protein SLEP1_g45185 [Rubroshorea leprosula]|uniref:Protein kinase domain-containing protein n=1 Tax=Rubroshorea leprosula TaxID=152421 RepID=A0AAV5LIZ3_9ROSI|nr:hypothetical protein SLEP1_g45185 [Rubroshorea leprosula]
MGASSDPNPEASDEQQKRSEIYTYEAPWHIYAMNWSVRRDKKYRLSIASMLEHYPNRVEIVQLDDSNGEIRSDPNLAFEHPYPPTKTIFIPDKECQKPDLLATSADFLRIWRISDDHSRVELKSVLNGNKNSEFCGPLTSFDWNEAEPKRIGTSSIDTTCTIWDIERETVDTQLIAHDKELTSKVEPFRVGWVTYANEVLMWDSNSGKLSDFTCHFSFSINASSPNMTNDGIEFFLAPVRFQIPPNSASGYLGLFNTTTRDSSSNRIILVEFDTYQHLEWDPIEVQTHVGININSICSVVYTPSNASFHIRDTTDILITYNSTTKNLSVSWSYQNTKNPQENSTLYYLVDLRNVSNNWVTIGFSTSTGGVAGQHTLKSWKFNSSFNAKETNENSSRKIKIVVAIVVLVIVLLIGTLLAYVIIRQRKKVNKRAEVTNLTSINDDFEMGTGPRRFSYQDLASATNDFSQDRKLGGGGFGAIYRGYLADVDMLIAIKKISKGSKQGKKEYATEVKTISQLRHRNLVQLIGWCHERSEFLLVYEFMSNGSLDSHLFGKKSPFPWHIRYRITLGLASAILYLHEEWEQCVVHRDIQSSNVMLDSSFNVTLGDFGLAKLIDHELGRITTGLASTFGYLAPEYISTRKASKESDVFSFGVVILEIAIGRKSTDRVGEESDLGLVDWVWDLYGKGRLHSA